MDDLTVERFGPGVPWGELSRPKASPATLAARRIAFCGTSDLGVLESGGNGPSPEDAWSRERRLADTIRRWTV